MAPTLFDGSVNNARNTYVWKLWQRMPKDASDALWRKFNEVILRKFGPPRNSLVEAFLNTEIKR